MHAKFWWEKPEGERPLGRRRHRWKGNIKVDTYRLKIGTSDELW
jgi:hypothetical protein